jgi:tetratricopeptide (TPR) repeat protein
MRSWGWAVLLALAAASCGGPPDAVRPEAARPVETPVTIDALYRDAHQLAATNVLDSAEVLLGRVLGMDSSYLPAWKDLAAVEYDRALTLPAGSPERMARFRRAYGSFARVETLGEREANVYERLCEIAVALSDTQGFLKYAQLYAQQYPYDRQYYNVGVALFDAGDFPGVVKSQKEAIARFVQSNYIGGFHRQMGRAYMRMDRDQTAERILTAGVRAVEVRLEEIRSVKEGGEEARRRLRDDRIGMLLLLKRLHTTYKDSDKLLRVEQQLRDAGVME